jgi:hypothetical protein
MMKMKLWLNSNTDKGKIPVYSKGVRVYEGITELNDLDLGDCELWKCRQIDGYIDEPNLTLTLGRDLIDTQRDSHAYKAFIDSLKHINDVLWPEVPELTSFSNTDKKLRSKLTDRLGTPLVEINTNHKDYQEIVVGKSQSDLATEYMIDCMASPIALWETRKKIEVEGERAFATNEDQINSVVSRAADISLEAKKKIK